MNIDDITDALEHRHTNELEEAFKALVQRGYDRVTGATSKQAGKLLKPVAEALAGDDRIMPGDLVEDILERSELADRSFGAGARAVLAHLDFWTDAIASRGAR